MERGPYVMGPYNQACQAPALAERYINPCPGHRKGLQADRYAVGEQFVQGYRKDYVGIHAHRSRKGIKKDRLPFRGTGLNMLLFFRMSR